MRVEDIIKDKRGIKVVLSDSTYFIISEENYISYPFIKGNEINKEEILLIKENEKIIGAKKSAYNFMSKNFRSEIEVREYIKVFLISKEAINKLIEEFKRQGFINDLELAKNEIAKSLAYKRGRKLIKEKIAFRKISYDVANEAMESLDEVSYRHNLERLTQNYLKRYKNESMFATKNKIKHNLLNKGYLIEEIKEVLDNFIVDDESEIENAVRFIKKLLKPGDNLNLWPTKAKILEKLTNQGFENDTINTAIKEVLNNEN